MADDRIQVRRYGLRYIVMIDGEVHRAMGKGRRVVSYKYQGSARDAGLKELERRARLALHQSQPEGHA